MAVPARPVFIASDPQVITSEMRTLFESLAGRTLEPAQVEQLLINFASYRETLTRLDGQAACEQCLVAYATGTHLEDLGARVGVVRMLDKPAKCTVRFTLASVLGTDTPIPAGKRVGAYDQRYTFSVTVAGVIPAGQTYADIGVACTTTGDAPNGYAIGTVTSLLDPIAGVSTVSNTTITNEGVGTETDEALRSRIPLAHYGYGSAGSLGAYEFHTLSTGPEITACHITVPVPGQSQVRVAVLTNSGTPTAGQLEAVRASLSALTVRPITDEVVVVAATSLPYAIEAELVIYDSANADTVMAAVTAAATAFALARKKRLGVDVTPSQVQAALFVDGVYSITMIEPATALVAGDGEWCECTDILLSIVGTANG